MKIGRLRHSFGSPARGARSLMSVMTILLAISLVSSDQPCCQNFGEPFTPHDPLIISPDKAQHVPVSSMPRSGGAGTTCCYLIGANASLARMAMALLEKQSSSLNGVGFIASRLSWLPLTWQKVTPFSTERFSSSSVPLYLRFLHLLF